MALIECPDCGCKKVSTNADSCPECGNTSFYIRTGKTMTGKCYDCGGDGKEKSPHYASTCSNCVGTGKTSYFQVLNLQKDKKEWWHKRKWGREIYQFDDENINTWL